MTYEYGEPWEQSLRYACEITKADGTFITWPGDVSKRHRIVACINACAGLSNEHLEKIGLGGVAQMVEALAELKHNYADAGMQIRQLHAMLNSGLVSATLIDDAVFHAGPPLTAAQAAKWEWTGEQPRKLTRGESGLCEPRHDSERPWIMRDCPTSESTWFYWPLRRRLHTQSTETSAPQPATLNDIADLLRRILDRMPERGVE